MSEQGVHRQKICPHGDFVPCPQCVAALEATVAALQQRNEELNEEVVFVNIRKEEKLRDYLLQALGRKGETPAFQNAHELGQLLEDVIALQQQVQNLQAKAALADDAYEFVETHEGGNGSGARAMLKRARDWCDRYDALSSPDIGKAKYPMWAGDYYQGDSDALREAMAPDTGSEEDKDG